MSDSLLSCPICDVKDAKIFQRDQLWVASCENDDCRFTVEIYGTTPDDAALSWNTRGAPRCDAESADGIECAIGVSSPMLCSAGHCRRCSDFREGWNAALALPAAQGDAESVTVSREQAKSAMLVRALQRIGLACDGPVPYSRSYLADKVADIAREALLAAVGGSKEL